MARSPASECSNFNELRPTGPSANDKVRLEQQRSCCARNTATTIALGAERGATIAALSGTLGAGR